MRKRITLLMLLIILLYMLCGCNNANNASSASSSAKISTEDQLVIDIEEDKQGRIIQKTVYDNYTKRTYIYTFNYGMQGLECFVVSTDVVVISPSGVVIHDTSN